MYFDPTHMSEDYIHRVGRTGRARRAGTGITLVLPEQRRDVVQLVGTPGRADAFAVSGISLPVRRQGPGGRRGRGARA